MGKLEELKKIMEASSTQNKIESRISTRIENYCLDIYFEYRGDISYVCTKDFYGFIETSKLDFYLNWSVFKIIGESKTIECIKNNLLENRL
jgi:hypothetical protein